MAVREFSTLFMPHQAMLDCILSFVSHMSLESSSEGGLSVNLKLPLSLLRVPRTRIG
jgi:hypothetical protein